VQAGGWLLWEKKEASWRKERNGIQNVTSLAPLLLLYIAKQKQSHKDCQKPKSIESIQKKLFQSVFIFLGLSLTLRTSAPRVPSVVAIRRIPTSYANSKRHLSMYWKAKGVLQLYKDMSSSPDCPNSSSHPYSSLMTF
jgi:hypothetical protein